MNSNLRTGQTYIVAETNQRVLITAMPGFDRNLTYILMRVNGKPHCYGFGEFSVDFVEKKLVARSGLIEVLLGKDKKEVADKILSRRGM